jgi:hypothetical protein
MSTLERRYQMTRVRAGSYLLPSNDAQTLWHIYSFTDGRSYGLDFPDRTFWGCAKYLGTYDEAIRAVESDMDEWGYIRHDESYPSYRSTWKETDTYMDTRAEAIRAALKQENA